MPEITRRGAIKAAGAFGLGMLGSGTATAETFEASESDIDGKLVGTWTASHHYPRPETVAAQGLNEGTIRQVIHTSVGGDKLRIGLSNVFGKGQLALESVTVAIRDEGASAVSDTVTEVTFDGASRVEIPEGERVSSDEVPLSVRAEQDILVSFYVPEKTGRVSWHRFGKNRTYSGPGNNAHDASDSLFTNYGSSYFVLDRVDVVNPDIDGAIVALGDSITDGTGSTIGANETFPDHLTRRINDRQTVSHYIPSKDIQHKSVLNAGIGGNRLLSNGSEGSGFGESALERLDRDVLSQSGVTDVVLFEGINDILHDLLGMTDMGVTADDLIAGMREVIERCHAADIRVIGGTITPVKGYLSGSNAEEGERIRQNVNEFVRTSGEFDGVVDFAAALEDPDNPGYIKPEYDSDGLHPNDRGYAAMANQFDLGMLIDW